MPKINDLTTRPGGPQPTDEIWLASAGGAADFKSTITALTNAVFNPDDIQVGVFSPTLRGSSADPSVTYQNQTGRYWKLGRLAFVEVRVDWTSVTGGSGNVRVELPSALTCAYNAFSNVMAVQTLRVVYPSGVTSVVARPREGERVVEFIGQGSNLAGAATVGLTNLNSDGRLSFSGVMITNS